MGYKQLGLEGSGLVCVQAGCPYAPRSRQQQATSRAPRKEWRCMLRKLDLLQLWRAIPPCRQHTQPISSTPMRVTHSGRCKSLLACFSGLRRTASSLTAQRVAACMHSRSKLKNAAPVQQPLPDFETIATAAVLQRCSLGIGVGTADDAEALQQLAMAGQSRPSFQ